MPLFHTVVFPQMIEQRWNKLSSLLRQYLNDQLLQLPSPSPQPPWRQASSLCLDRRLELVESLRVLCSDENAWLRYRTVRAEQLDNLMAKLMPAVSCRVCFIDTAHTDRIFLH